MWLNGCGFYSDDKAPYDIVNTLLNDACNKHQFLKAAQLNVTMGDNEFVKYK